MICASGEFQPSFAQAFTVGTSGRRRQRGPVAQTEISFREQSAGAASASPFRAGRHTCSPLSRHCLPEKPCAGDNAEQRLRGQSRELAGIRPTKNPLVPGWGVTVGVDTGSGTQYYSSGRSPQVSDPQEYKQ